MRAEKRNVIHFMVFSGERNKRFFFPRGKFDEVGSSTKSTEMGDDQRLPRQTKNRILNERK